MSQLSQFIGGTGGDEIGSLPVFPREFFQSGETYTALSGNTYLATGVLLESSTVANAASLPGITLENQGANTSAGSSGQQNLHYVNNLWLFSFSSTLYTSTDGEAWTNRGTHGATGFQQLSAEVLWTGTNYYIPYTAGNSTIAGSTSSDGVTWTQRVHGGFLTLNSTATNGSGVIVAVGAGSAPTTAINTIARSTNHGASFITATLASSTVLEKVIYGNSQFVAVGGSGTSMIQTSSTGASGTWTSRTVPSASYRAVIWNGSVFVALGGASYDSNGTTGTYSADGVTWSTSTVPSAVYRDIAWNGTIFVAVGASGTGAGTTCATSTDGITWVSRTIPQGLYYRIQWTGTYFVAFCTAIPAGNAFRIGVYSTDGVIWKDITCTNASTAQSRSVYGNGKIVSMVGVSQPTVNVNDSSTFANFYTGVASAVGSVDSNTQLTRALRIS